MNGSVGYLVLREIEVKKPLLSRDFVLASLAYFFVFLAVAVFYLFPLYLNQFHPSKSKLGLIMGIHSVTAIMVRPLFGRILDEKGGAKVAIAGLIVMLASIPGFYFVNSAGMLALFLRAINGIGWGVATTAIMAICSELAPPERMAHSLGIIGAAGIVSGAIGPTMAEEMMRRYGFHSVFSLAIVMLIASLGCILAIKRGSHNPVNRGYGWSLGLKAYPRWILLIIAAMPIAHGAVRGTVINFIALFGESIGFNRIGPFFMAFAAAAILTRLGIGDISDKYGRKRVILPSAVLIGVNLFGISINSSYGFFVVSGFIAGFGQGLIFPALSTYVIDFLGRQNKGLALGLYLSLFDVGMGLGSPVFGWVSDIWGYRHMYAIAGGLIIALTFIFSIKAPAIPSVIESRTINPLN
jgi:MFS family permease